MRKSRAKKGSDSAKDRKRSRPWSDDEDARLRVGVERYGCRNWTKISLLVGKRSSDQCCQRWYRSLRPEIRKGPWSEDEDEQLVVLVQEHGTAAWKRVAEFIDGRTDIQCRSRWLKISRRRKKLFKTIKDPESISSQDAHTNSTQSSASRLDSAPSTPSYPTSPISSSLIDSTPIQSPTSVQIPSSSLQAPQSSEIQNTESSSDESNTQSVRKSKRARVSANIKKISAKSKSACKKSGKCVEKQQMMICNDAQESLASILVDMSCSYYAKNEASNHMEQYSEVSFSRQSASCEGLLSLYSVATTSDAEFSSFSDHLWVSEGHSSIDNEGKSLVMEPDKFQVDRRMMLAHILNSDVQDSS